MSAANTEHEGPAWIEGKDPRMELLSEEPLVMATPVGLLAGHRITPKESLFVRNIQDLPGGNTLEPHSLEGWEIELSGLIEPSRVVIQAEELLGMDEVEYEMVLQCSGNGRFMYADIPGTPWTQGGVGNVRFAGVPLSAVLEKHGVKIASPLIPVSPPPVLGSAMFSSAVVPREAWLG